MSDTSKWIEKVFDNKNLFTSHQTVLVLGG
jgi:hypothetical protein